MRWKPAPLLYFSLALHLGAITVALALPGAWPWALAAVIINHLLLAAMGLWPRSSGLGPNRTRLPHAATARGEVVISIDDGPDPGVTPQVLTLLAAHGAQATFFCIGERIERHPDLARAIVRAGHAIENHSQRHLHYFSLLGPRRMRHEIEQAQRTIATVTGDAPRFFRAPAGLRNPLLDMMLSRLDLQLVSWTRRGFDTVSADADTVYARLTRNLSAGDILLLHDGHAARTRTGIPIILEVLPRLLKAVVAAGLKPVTLRSAMK